MLNFISAFAVSFLGSIPLGSLNLTAIQIYLQSNFKSVVYFSLSASVIEFFYSYLAIKGEIYISENDFINSIFSYISILVFLLLGFSNLKSTNNSMTLEKISYQNSLLKFNYNQPIRKGLMLSVLNPQAIPFWIILSNFLKKEGLVQFQSVADILYYTMGVAFGTFFCLLTLTLFVGKILKQKNVRMVFLNKSIGVLLIAMGFIQIGKIIMER